MILCLKRKITECFVIVICVEQEEKIVLEKETNLENTKKKITKADKKADEIKEKAKKNKSKKLSTKNKELKDVEQFEKKKFHEYDGKVIKLSNGELKRIKKLKKKKTFNMFNAERYNPDVKHGLSSSQINERIQNNLINDPLNL